MLFKGNSSKLELLIEKIQANKENGTGTEAGSVAHEEVSVGGSSWDVGSDGRGSLSPASSATPTSASETDVEAAATVGVTQSTPYQCSFCDRAFPRLSYLKRHEQLHGMYAQKTWPCISVCSPRHVLSSVIESYPSSETHAGMSGEVNQEPLDKRKDSRGEAALAEAELKKVAMARGVGPRQRHLAASPYDLRHVCYCGEGQPGKLRDSRGNPWSGQGSQAHFEARDFPPSDDSLRRVGRETPCRLHKEGRGEGSAGSSLRSLALLDTWLAQEASLAGSRSPSNVWTEENVVNYVERELKELQVQHTAARVAESISISEQVFHFVEMELRRLNADMELESTPPPAPRSALPYEVFRTPTEQLPARLHRASFTSPTPTEYGSDAEITRLTHSGSSQDDDAFPGDSSSSSLMKEAQETRVSDARTEKALKPVLCLKHLDQLPTSLCHYSQTPAVGPKEVACSPPFTKNSELPQQSSIVCRKPQIIPPKDLEKALPSLRPKTKGKLKSNFDVTAKKQTRHFYMQKVKGKKRERQKNKKKVRELQKSLREVQSNLEKNQKVISQKADNSYHAHNLTKSQTNSLSVQIPLSRVSLRRNINIQDGQRANAELPQTSENGPAKPSRYGSPKERNLTSFTPESEVKSGRVPHSRDLFSSPFVSSVHPETRTLTDPSLRASDVPRRLPPTPHSPRFRDESLCQPMNSAPYPGGETSDLRGYIPYVQPYSGSVYSPWQTFPYPHLSPELGMNNLPCQTLCAVPLHSAIPWQHNVTPPHAIPSGPQGLCIPFLDLSGRPPPGARTDPSWLGMPAVCTPPDSCPPGRAKYFPKRSSQWPQSESPFLMQSNANVDRGESTAYQKENANWPTGSTRHPASETSKSSKMAHRRPERKGRADQGHAALHIQVRTGALAEQRGKSRAILSRLDPQNHKSASRIIQVRTREKSCKRDEADPVPAVEKKVDGDGTCGSDANNNEFQLPNMSSATDEQNTIASIDGVKAFIQPVVKCNQALQNVSVQFANEEAFPTDVGGDWNKFRYKNYDLTHKKSMHKDTEVPSGAPLTTGENETINGLPSPGREAGDENATIKRYQKYHPYILPKKRHKSVFRSLSKAVDIKDQTEHSPKQDKQSDMSLADEGSRKLCNQNKGTCEDKGKPSEPVFSIGSGETRDSQVALHQNAEKKDETLRENSGFSISVVEESPVPKGMPPLTPILPTITVSPSSMVRQGAHFGLIRKIAPCLLRPNPRKVLSRKGSLMNRYLANKKRQMSFLNRRAGASPKRVKRSKHYGAPSAHPLHPEENEELDCSAPMLMEDSSLVEEEERVTIYSTSGEAERTTINRDYLAQDFCTSGEVSVTGFSIFQECFQSCESERDGSSSIAPMEVIQLQDHCTQSQTEGKESISMYEPGEYATSSPLRSGNELHGSGSGISKVVPVSNELAATNEMFSDSGLSICSEEFPNTHYDIINPSERDVIAKISIEGFEEGNGVHPDEMTGPLDGTSRLVNAEKNNELKGPTVPATDIQTVGIPCMDWETFGEGITYIAEGPCPRNGALLESPLISGKSLVDKMEEDTGSTKGEPNAGSSLSLKSLPFTEEALALPNTCDGVLKVEHLEPCGVYLHTQSVDLEGPSQDAVALHNSTGVPTSSKDPEASDEHQDLLALALRTDLLDVLTAETSWPEAVTLTGEAEEAVPLWETSCLAPSEGGPSPLNLREGGEPPGNSDHGASLSRGSPAPHVSWEDEERGGEDMECGESADGRDSSSLIPGEEAPWSPQQRDSSSSSCSSSVAEEYEEEVEVPLEAREDEGSGGGGSGAEYEPGEIKEGGGGGLSGGRRRRRRGKSSYLIDVLTHADQLPFRCEFCGRLFKHKRSRDRHVKLHTGDKKYKCCHCEAAFSRSDHLKIHMKTHDTQKPYQCSVCNRGYNTAAALTAHMQNHKAKLTAHALSQLLKDAQAPSDTHALSQLLKDSSVAETHAHQALNNFLKDAQKEQLISPKSSHDVVVAGSSPVALTASPVGEASPALSPVATVRCPVCHAHCRNHTHLQRHLSRYHGDEAALAPSERPASRGGGSGGSSVGGASSVTSTPSPRPPSSLPSPRPLANPLLSLVGGKLACLYCSRDGFPSLEALQLHLHSTHGSVLNGEVREMTNLLGLPASLGGSLSAAGLAASLASPLGPGSSRGVSCELCGARVSGVTALQRHVLTAHTFTDLLARAAEGVFCAQCLLPFSNPGALAEHIKLVHTAPPVLSAVLNKRPPSPPTDTPTDLSKKSRHDGGLTAPDLLPASTLLCSQCNAPFTNFEAFRRHLKSHLEGQADQVGSSVDTQLICPECRLPLESETALESHLATHLGATSTEYGCQACLKLFAKPDELQKHLMDIHAHHLYRCALCKEMFDSKVSIQVHFAVKHSNECKVHKCTRCSLLFRSQAEFEVHIRSSHLRRGALGVGGDVASSGGGSLGCGGGGSYRCLLCTLSLSSEAELAAHVATHQRQFQCTLCDDAFHVEFLLDKHMQTQHNSELNGNVPQPENLVKPRRSPHKKELKCDICDAEFSTDSGLLTHRKQAHNIKSGSVGAGAKVAAASLSLFCAYCSEACKSRSDLEAHMKSHQGSGGRHKCNICDELCPSAALLAQHKLTHVKVVSGSACAVCREPLTSEQQFTSHQSEHHPAPLPQPCVVCRQTLVTDMEVSVHARFHAAQAAQAAAAASVAASGGSFSSELLPPSSNALITTTAAMTGVTTSSNSSSSRGSISPRQSPALRCPECHLKLETIEEAEAHAAVHQQQHQGYGRSAAASSRTYQCIKCQESFASEAEIEAHVASHLLHEGSVHECHLCRATFDTPLRLQCHLIEHTFEGCGSFTCYMCSSVFTTASRLQQHMVEHGLSARPYDCHHCHQRFFFRAELENHALSHPEAADGACRECVANFPDLPRRHLRRASLSALTSQHIAAHTRPPSPCSPRDGDVADGAPASANGHLPAASADATDK